MTRVRFSLSMAALSAFCAVAPMPAPADTRTAGEALGYAGMPGLIEMPTADALPDAEFGSTLSATPYQSMQTLTFQALPRLTGSFRYGRFEGLADSLRYDRSFDLQGQLWGEAPFRPAVAVGLRDLIGTGLNSSEYIVATGHLRPSLAVTAGLGWGRMSTQGGRANPFGWDSRDTSHGLGGRPQAAAWFHGPMAVFGGVSWQANDRLRLALEYSSDAHPQEVAHGVLEDRTPFDLGVSYVFRPGMTMAADLLHGSALGLSLNVTLNPKSPPSGGDHSPAPPPFRSEADVRKVSVTPFDPAQVKADLAVQGVGLVGLVLDGDTARLRVNNRRYIQVSQMLGRVSRILSADLPPRISTFDIESSVQGMTPAHVLLQRQDLVQLQYDPSQTDKGRAAAEILPAHPPFDPALPIETPLQASMTPYVSLSLFDPVNPFRADFGLQEQASYAFSQNLSISGSVRLKLLGDEGDSDRSSDSILQHVRSDAELYARDGASGLHNLTLDDFGQIGTDIYTHVSFGYLEPMFAGVVTEVLWQPIQSRLQLGAELDRVVQRNTDELFGVGDYDYGITLGHVSVYYQPTDGLDVQLDAGRYLAGDWGSTLTVSRTFGNGWRIGAFATLTDASFKSFGEGSFDKGFVITVPLGWFTGQPTSKKADVVLRPIQRDGGAQLALGNRLHDLLRDQRQKDWADSWGSFWR